MTDLAVYATAATFDTLRQVTSTGREWWSARDLMAPLGYDRWERFADAIERAEAACNNSGMAAQDHFRASAKKVEIGLGAERTVADYALTRYGAYLLAMNGDPRKPEIAAAQTYFAVRAREAETNTVAALPRSYADALRELASTVEERDMAAAALAVAAPKAEQWDILASAEGDYSVADAAKFLARDPRIEIGRDRLFAVLSELRWIYRSGADSRWRVYQTAIETGRLSEIPMTRESHGSGELLAAPPQVRVTVKGLGDLWRHLTAERAALPAGAVTR